MLIASPRHSAEDLILWRDFEETDLLRAQQRRMSDLEERAMRALESFAPDYVSVSWGKDSVVVAHLACRLGLDCPLVWFPAGQIENPDCALVRDAFLARHPMHYREIAAPPLGDFHDLHGHDGAQKEFERVSKVCGERYASGVRADESGTRKLRMRVWGESSQNTCAPIGWWPTDFVFAYLAKYDLPIHPMYACLGDGRWDREHLRVGTLGGYRGRQHGRHEHERSYYGAELRRLGLY